MLPQAPQTATVAPPATAQPANDEKDLKTDAGETPEVDQRTPEEKKVDAKAIQQILASAPASIDISNVYPKTESVKFTLDEAKINNFYEKLGNWYDSNGCYVGKKWYCDATNTILIFK